MRRRSKLVRISVTTIIGVLLAFAIVLIYRHYTSVQIDWTKTKDVFDVFKNIATIIAFAVGAIWAYFNFFKGRTYRPRVEPKVVGKLITKNGTSYLIITSQLKNIGLSDVQINQKGSALRVFAYMGEDSDSTPRTLEQSRLITVSVFEDHGWIEPGELIEDQRIVVIPNIEYVAVQAKLRLVSCGIEWNSAAIIEPPIPEHSTNQPQLKEPQPILEDGTIHTSDKDKVPVSEKAAGSEELANIVMQKEEDTEESRKIEEEKEPVTLIDVEQNSLVDEQKPTSLETIRELPQQAE